MKRGFFYLAAGALALTACTSEEVLDESVVQSNAIGFENVVNKQTRDGVDGVSIDNNNFDKFSVFGYYTKKGLEANAIQVFDDVLVTKKDDKWGYVNTRYWVPGASYKFYAYSCGDIKLNSNYGSFSVDFNQSSDDNRVFKITNYKCDAEHQHDLLFAQTEKITGKEKGEGNETVLFTFKHILSMIDAQFISALPSDYTIEISDVKIEKIYNEGDFDSKKNKWSGYAFKNIKEKDPYVELPTTVKDENGKVIRTYITAQSAEKDENGNVTATGTATEPTTQLAFVLPCKYTDNVKFSFRIKVINGTEKNTVLDRNVSGSWKPEWQFGHKYTYRINISGSVAHLDAIEFGVEEITDWEKDDTSDPGINFEMEFDNLAGNN